MSQNLNLTIHRFVPMRLSAALVVNAYKKASGLKREVKKDDGN